MRQVLKTLAVLAFSRAIAEKAIENLDPDKQNEKQLYLEVSRASMSALSAWPDRITRKDIMAIKRRIDGFCKEIGWDHRGKSIQTYTAFILELLESLRKRISDTRKITAVDTLIEKNMDIYWHYTDGPKKREYPLCVTAGLRAADIWNRYMEG